MTMVSVEPHQSDAQHLPTPLWRNLNYVVLVFGQTVSLLGTRISGIAFPLLVLAITNSYWQSGLISAARGIPYALFALPAGALVDRWDRKRTMWICDTGRFLAIGSIAVALVIGQISFIHLTVAAFIDGIFFLFFNMAEASAIPHVVAPEQIGKATAQGQAVENVSFIVGSSASGFLISFGLAFPFVVDTISYLFSVISLLWIKVDFQQQLIAPNRSLWAEIHEGISWLWHHPLLRFIALLTGGLNFFSMGFPIFLIALAKHVQANNQEIGILFATGSFGAVLGALAADYIQRRFQFGHIMVVSSWLWALTWLFYPFAPNIWLLGIGNMIGFIIVPIYIVTQYSYRLRVVPDALMGRVNSVFRLIAFGSEPLSLAIAGALVEGFGPMISVIIIFVPQLLLAVIATANKRLRQAIV